MNFHMTHQAVLNNQPAQMIPVLKVSFNTVKKDHYICTQILLGFYISNEIHKGSAFSLTERSHWYSLKKSA